MSIFEDYKELEIESAEHPRAVYKRGNSSITYGITIPKEFAKEMGIDTKKKCYVNIKLVRAEGKKVYCIIEKYH